LGCDVFHAQFLSESEKMGLPDKGVMNMKKFRVFNSKHLMLSALGFTHNFSNENRKKRSSFLPPDAHIDKIDDK
jgi:hypothetical protein